jgi:hypothetical protein
MNEEKIRQALIMFPGSRRGADGVILGDEKSGLFYITDFGLVGDRRDHDLALEEDLLLPFCAKNEIIRLREVKSPHDYLLRFRATAIANSPRLARVMSARRKRFERGGRIWSLSGYYDTLNGVAKGYLARLPGRDQKIIRPVPFGFAPLIDANAACLKSLVGEVVIVSEALKNFYYFMTICLHGGYYGIDLADRAAAGVIGLRILNGSEAQDFDIDPRGILHAQIEGAIRSYADEMLEFTFGHEFAHLLLNHFASVGPMAVAVRDADRMTYSHDEEYAADLHAVRVIKGRDARATLARAAYNTFLSLHLIELASEAHPDAPKLSMSVTHPAPLDRLRNLREMLGDRDQPERYRLGMAVKAARDMRGVMLEWIRRANKDNLLTFYGSVYMRGLGGKERQDRIDY